MVKKMIERPRAVKFGGNELTVLGRQLEVGNQAPEFTVEASDFSSVSLADSTGKVRLISVVPSLDTSVCDAQTRRFNQEAGNFGGGVVFLTISAEHPLNQKRWCNFAEVDRVQVLSDHMDMNFGNAYGTHIKERRLEQRSIFVVDKNDMIRYVEYVRETGQLPDIDKALEAAREAAGS
ncbi:MAG: thiol peroxidase [Anaerolineae bacterium]|nr:MAG: thiol peroxidase [Anaerolineae bacterium]